MILYSGNAAEFIQDTNFNRTADKLKVAFESYYYHKPGPAEVTAWINSLQYAKNLLEINDLHSTMVILEYELPYSSQRIDMSIFGRDSNSKDNMVIVELKQWSQVEPCDIDDNIITYLGGKKQMHSHPSYQVQGYHNYLKDFVTLFEEKPEVILSSCVYCHNYPKNGYLLSNKYAEIIKQFPVFTKDDFEQIGNYLKARLSQGNGLELFNRFKTASIKPSKKLIKHAREMIQGQKAFYLLDEQITANNAIIDRAKKCARLKHKSVIIIQGGPGTGKSVIALNAIAELLNKGLSVYHATGSKSFTSTLRKIVGTRAGKLFKYFNTFKEKKYKINDVDVLVCDEAHRIRKSSNDRYTRREHISEIPQIDELVRVAKVSIFFIDDHQIVKPEEIGNSNLIKKAAIKFDADIYEFELKTQFRCSGSDGYLNWIDNLLDIRETANKILTVNEKMDFKIFDSPNALYDAIKEKNAQKPNSARMVAGFCWPWSNPNPDGTLVEDIVIGDFKMSWEGKDNKILAKDIPPWYLWAFDQNGFSQCGCIYTVQGFEFDYIGVIFGNDLVYDLKKKKWIGIRENSKDPTLKVENFADYARNVYRVLLTRGMKGCYVYFLDKDTERFFKSRMEKPVIKVEEKKEEKILREVAEEEKFVEYLPVYSLRAAAGKFSEGQEVEEEGWIKADIGQKLGENMFVAKVVGHSMEPRIPDNSYCVFSFHSVGSRQGKIVLAQHRDIQDVETGGSYTVKRYRSEKKVESEDQWHHEKIILEPLNKDYEPIIITPESEGDFKIIAEFVTKL